MSKKYGLIIPKSKKTTLIIKKLAPKPSVFGNDSDSDDTEESKKKEVNAEIHQVAMKNMMRKQTQIEMQKALEEDPTVYDYDEIYDDMKQKAQAKLPENIVKADKKREPKYIKNILKAAELRKLEQERREERIIQREREKEGDEFSDKPQFVTSAYREKLKAQEALKEEERRQDAIENALDVRKQNDLSGFYRHFLNQQTGEEATKSNIKEENEQPTENTNIDADSDLSSEEEFEVDVAVSENSKNTGQKSSSANENQNASSSDESSEPEKYKSHKETKQRHEESRRKDEDRKRHRNEKHRYRRSSSREYSSHRSERRSKDSRHRDDDKHRDSKRSGDERRERSYIKHKDETASNKNRDMDGEQSKRDDNNKKKTFDKEKEREPESIINEDEDNEPNKYQKRTTQDSVMSARDRYLARKNAAKSAAVIASDSE